MLELTSDERPVYLSPGTSVQLELNSSLFDEEVVAGSYAYTFAVPAKPNGPLYRFPERLDAHLQPGAEMPAALRLDGLPLLTGTQRVRSASEKKYSISLSGTLGGLASALSNRPIHSFDFGGVRHMPAARPWGGGAVGGLLQVPGWVPHANEVVRQPAAYDYVFAPVRCDSFYEPVPKLTDPPGPLLAPAVLNPWVANAAADGSTYGLPAGGSFSYVCLRGYVQVSQAQAVLPAYGQFACPFPKLRYVLRSIFQESGIGVDESQFLPGELGELVIVSPANTIRTSQDAAGVVQSSFHLADSLPDLTVAQLLQALRRDLGIIVDVDPADRRVFTRYLRDVVAAPAADDYSAQLAGGAEVNIDVATVLKLVYATDPDDEVTNDLLKQAPDPALLGQEVETLAQLPATGNIGLPAQTRLVRQEAAYYKSRSTWAGLGTGATLTWEYVSPYLEGVEIGGPDGEELSQVMVFTQLGRAPFTRDPADPGHLDPSAAAWMEVPAMQRPGFEPGKLSPQAPPRPTALRLLFWRGLQPASDGTLYPLVTPLHTNQLGQVIGQLSTRLGGPAGTYNQLLRGWLEVKRRNIIIKQALRLTSLDLARLDLTRKIRLDGVEYLVRKLSATVPLRKPVGAELVRVG